MRYLIQQKKKNHIFYVRFLINIFNYSNFKFFFTVHYALRLSVYKPSLIKHLTAFDEEMKSNPSESGKLSKNIYKYGNKSQIPSYI